MENRFHLAIPAGNLDKAIKFYCDTLGCSRGNAEFKYPDAWVDINFWGNELTLHEAQHQDEIKSTNRHHVDMGEVCVPHFGIHLSRDAFDEVKKRIDSTDKHTYLDKPYLRFKDDDREQETFFIRDPSGNALEIKTMKVPESLWEINS